jgi:hypothetical protein
MKKYLKWLALILVQLRIFCVTRIPQSTRNFTSVNKTHKKEDVFRIVPDSQRFYTDTDPHHWITDPDPALFLQ